MCVPRPGLLPAVNQAEFVSGALPASWPPPRPLCPLRSQGPNPAAKTPLGASAHSPDLTTVSSTPRMQIKVLNKR